jgi:hypothetical protein
MHDFPFRRRQDAPAVPPASRGADPLQQSTAQLDAYAVRQTGHVTGCGCLSCDGWRYRGLTKGIPPDGG